ncbi:MAG: S16 family serine protease [Vampirovibrionales bacterium]|nr:S16 family serine protease [Vampirovibrionales bacterium]
MTIHTTRPRFGYAPATPPVTPQAPPNGAASKNGSAGNTPKTENQILEDMLKPLFEEHGIKTPRNLLPLSPVTAQLLQIASAIRSATLLKEGASRSGKHKEKLDDLHNLPEGERLMTDDQYQEISDRIRQLGGQGMGGQMGYGSEQIDTILNELPWKLDPNPPKIDLAKAKQILDAGHDGMDETKQIILEKLAGLQRAQQAGSKNTKAPRILCLVGTPGTGKTTLAESIAKAMDKEFVSINVAGMDQASEITGHSYGYIGARPGVIMSAMKGKKHANRVLMLIDEVDKLGKNSLHGNPFYALLPLFDPAQNHKFRDNYLRLNYDMSGVTFIVTANDKNEIPPALIDRIEVVDVPEYSIADKQRIAKTRLLPKLRKANGLSEQDLPDALFTDKLMTKIIDRYAFTGGLRNLEKALGQIARKRALQLQSPGLGPKTPLTPETLSDWVDIGFRTPRQVRTSQIGRVNGLAYLPDAGGGRILPLTAVKLESVNKGEHALIAKVHGGVKTEEGGQDSAGQAALYIETHQNELMKQGLNPNLPKDKTIRISVGSEGFSPFDGASAGIANVAVILSSLTNRKIKGDVAMTGAITTSGQVKAISGLMGKIEGAYRAGCKTVLIPWENWDDRTQQVIDGGRPVKLSPQVLAQVKIIPVKRFVDAVPHVFEPETPKSNGHAASPAGNAFSSAFKPAPALNAEAKKTA